MESIDLLPVELALPSLADDSGGESVDLTLGLRRSHLITLPDFDTSLPSGSEQTAQIIGAPPTDSGLFRSSFEACLRLEIDLGLRDLTPASLTLLDTSA